ncbi:insulinase family protein [Congregibacter litoralis]|uniref:Putative Zn-dependent peptidase, insulinase-like protein n=1 Tax=Congregibacter litoralis KT71 TaxID=314285 RepID=A4ACD3_9GAMM|nr:insulinase family protein [Congregibacter litoralis]EAQ96361.1 putative Zn-dependent peptidase, insulinase-like protein [Congregibacter litoralis KT71]
MNSPSNLPIAHDSFIPLRAERIDALNIRVEQFEHRETGAIHYHFASDNTENVFLVALRTVPEDSRGVAHILEHTALCGSEHYPVRDPFFMMLRRSLNTFMNAFTSADWTAYPFASQNRKDFRNLLDVYLDAVFFSKLDPLDFAQEGHRVEFEESGNTESELVYKGVVFNEMKGAMSSVPSRLWQTLCHHLFPTSTYHYNSGGEPEHIPELSYDQLQSFYKSHYHPSNATFMTFGDIPAAEHQAVFHEQALQNFTRLDKRIVVNPEVRYTEPKRVTEPYAFDEEGSSERRTHIVMGWLLGESSELKDLLEAQLLSSVLMENSASPLQKALETTELGTAPSPLCGLEDSLRELVFCCGIEGSEASHEEALEKLVLDVIEDIATNGVPREQLEAVLHQLELHQREISGDGMPFGLNLILQALGPATHYADPVPSMDLEPVIAQLREQIQNPDYIRGLARNLLIENPHRVTLVMTPDGTLSEKKREEERQRLAALKSSLDASEKQAIVTQAAALLERQAQEDDPELLPKVTLEDVPGTLPKLSYQETNIDGLPFTLYEQGTNGLVYQQLSCSIPQLSAEELTLLPHLTGMTAELGLGDADYLATQHRQSSSVGSISLFTSMRGSIEDEQVAQASLALSSKALARKSAEQSKLMRDTLLDLRFDELPRIRELVAQQRARREQSITGQGHSLAMLAACAGMSPLAMLHHELSGMEGIAALRRLDDSLAETGKLEAFARQLQQLHAKLQNAEWEALIVAEPGRTTALAEEAASIWKALPSQSDSSLSLPMLRETRRECWVANSQVSFCAKAYATVPSGHADAAALTVLSGYLRNGFLHRAIREQGGAYGGGASHDASIAAFRFYSYRDPRIEGTLEDFDASIAWMATGDHSPASLEEAILGVISTIDKPGSPAGEAKQDFHNRRFGRNHEQRMAFRQRILNVTLEDLQRVAAEYLVPENASIAVVTGNAARRDSESYLQSLNMRFKEL